MILTAVTTWHYFCLLGDLLSLGTMTFAYGWTGMGNRAFHGLLKNILKSDQKLMTYKAKSYMSDTHSGEESGEFLRFLNL